MKFLALAYLATAVAASVVRRDLATITGVLASVGADLDGLNTAAKSFTGEPTALLDASNKAIQGLKDGDAKVQPLPGLSLTDALGLTGPAKDLQTKGDALLATMKDKKAAIAAAGMCDVTRLQVADLQSASDALIKSVVSKVPTAAQSIAQGLVAPLQKDLADAVDLFSAANCQNGGGGSTSAPASSSAAPTTSVAPTSTKPATTTAAPTTTKPATTTAAPTTTKPATTTVPTIPATTSAGPGPTTTAPGPGNGTCPAASTVTVTSTDTKDCTPTPTCTKTPPVTVTATTKACPTGSKLPW